MAAAAPPLFIGLARSLARALASNVALARVQMRRTTLRVLILLALAPSVATGQVGARAAVGSDSLHRLIAGFLAEPIKNGPSYRAIIDSAEKSPYVKITISAGVAPWTCEMPRGEMGLAIRSLLLGAFIAGNMRAQLDSAVKGDRPVAGVRAALGVYEQVKSRVVDLALPTMERWLELRQAGRLDSVITEVASHPLPGCPKSENVPPAG
jgi:hypothetical protein